MSETIAEMRLPTQELREDIPFFTKVLGMKMDMIYPADDPSVAVFSGHGLRLRSDKQASEAPGTLRRLCDDPDGFADGEPRGAGAACATGLSQYLLDPQSRYGQLEQRLARGAQR